MAMPMGEFGDVAARLLDTQLRANSDRVRVRQMFSASLVTRASTIGPIPSSVAPPG
jgi:hypothetical protein